MQCDPSPRSRATRALRLGAHAFVRRATALRRAPGSRDQPLLATQLCALATELLPVDGSGIAVLFGPGMSVPVGVSDDDAATAEAIQFTIGRGPCWRVYETGRPVALEHLDDSTSVSASSLPIYAAQLVVRTPYRSVVCLPVGISEDLSASLALYRRSPDAACLLSEPTALDAVAIATAGVLGRWPRHRAAASPPAAWLDSPSSAVRQQVWQAESELMESTGGDPASALATLRGYAFSHDRTVDDVAADLNARRLRVADLLADR